VISLYISSSFNVQLYNAYLGLSIVVEITLHSMNKSIAMGPKGFFQHIYCHGPNIAQTVWCFLPITVNTRVDMFILKGDPRDPNQNQQTKLPSSNLYNIAGWKMDPDVQRYFNGISY